MPPAVPAVNDHSSQLQRVNVDDPLRSLVMDESVHRRRGEVVVGSDAFCNRGVNGLGCRRAERETGANPVGEGVDLR